MSILFPKCTKTWRRENCKLKDLRGLLFYMLCGRIFLKIKILWWFYWLLMLFVYSVLFWILYIRHLLPNIINECVNSSTSTTPLRLDDSSLRNAVDCLEIHTCIAINWSHCPSFCSDSMGLCLLLFTELSLKLEPYQSKTSGTITEFDTK